MTQYCPVCGKICREIYRNQDGYIAVGCGHCDTLPKIRCPKCGGLCRKVYRTAWDGDFIGCDVCINDLDAVADADARPEDYGLEANDE